MYVIIFRENNRASLKAQISVYENRERAEVAAEAARKKYGYDFWVIYFEDPRKD